MNIYTKKYLIVNTCSMANVKKENRKNESIIILYTKWLTSGILNNLTAVFATKHY